MTFVNVKPAPRVKNRPAANVLENDNGFTVQLATPGLSREDLTIKVEKDLLTIGASIENGTAEGIKTRRREFNYGNFKRTFQLPEIVDATGITASYENGILVVSIPKKEEAKPLPPRTIEIN